MSTLLSRFVTQIGLSLAGVVGLAALGEPLPLPEPTVEVELMAHDLRVAVADDIISVKKAADVAETAALRQAAAKIRWMITAPHAGLKPLRVRTADAKIAHESNAV